MNGYCKASNLNGNGGFYILKESPKTEKEEKIPHPSIYKNNENIS